MAMALPIPRRKPAAGHNHVLFGVVLAFIAAVLSGCQTFNVEMNYKCVSLVNVTGGLACGEWIQTGGVKQPNCFPAEARVFTREGPKSMQELNIGDEILGYDDVRGQAVFSKVRAWLHRHAEVEVSMSVVETKVATVMASSRHSLAVESGEGHSYVFAGDLQPGVHNLVTKDGAGALVQSVSSATAMGLYAPLTTTSNFFVGGPDFKQGVLAHSFAQLQDPRAYQGVFHLLLDFCEFFWPSVSNVDMSSNDAYLHPMARIWMKLAGISTTDQLTISRSIKTPNGDAGFDEITQEALAAVPNHRVASSGNNDNEQQLIIILLSVVQVMPPFLRHAMIPDGTPGYEEGPQGGTPLDVAQWVEEEVNKGWWFAVVSGFVTFCCFCCVQCLKIAAEDDDEGGGRRNVELT